MKQFATQGDGLLEAESSGGSVAEQAIKSLKAGERYIAGADSWGTTRLRIEPLDGAGASLGFAERFQSVANWRTSIIRFVAPPKSAFGKVTLRANGKTWWDNVFLTPENAIRRVKFTPTILKVADSEKSRTGAVVYLLNDRDTQGDWTGKYGNYAFILSAMSAPRDMVGGQVKPIKCDFRDWTKTFKNETIRVRGEGELRYTGWTGNPRDPEPRHWIDLDAMRTD